MKGKNTRSQTRPVSDPYETYESGRWTWKVLKHYQTAGGETENPYALVLCMVYSPVVPDGEMGDVYCRDIPGYRFDWKD